MNRENFIMFIIWTNYVAPFTFNHKTLRYLKNITHLKLYLATATPQVQVGENTLTCLILDLQILMLKHLFHSL